MKIKSYLAVVGIVVAQCVVPAAHAAGAIPIILGKLSPILTDIKIGKGNNLGTINLHVLGLDGIPVLGAVAGTVTLQEGLGILESVTVLQGQLLPGLPAGQMH